MSEKVGNVSFYDSSGQSEYSFSKPYSEKTAELIDQESTKLIETQYLRALEVIKANKDKHQKLAELLLEKEVIFSEDLEHIFGNRAWARPMMVSESKKEKVALSADNPQIAADHVAL